MKFHLLCRQQMPSIRVVLREIRIRSQLELELRRHRDFARGHGMSVRNSRRVDVDASNDQLNAIA